MTDQIPDTLFPDSVPSAPRRSTVKGKLSPKQARGVSLRGLEVTQADIDGAMRQNSHSCMIADALKRQIKGAKNVSVDLATIRWTDTVNNRRVVCLTPAICQDGLARFDLGIIPKPFKFGLRSAQVTTVPSGMGPRVDADGNPVRKKPVQVRRKDGTLSEHKNGTQQLKVLPPSPRVVKQGGGSDLVVGGNPVPKHVASVHRTFGVRAFTWLDGEDPRSVLERQKLGRFETVEPASDDTSAD